MISPIHKHGFLFTDRRIGQQLKIGENICISPLEVRGKGKDKRVKLNINSGTHEFNLTRGKYEKVIFYQPETGFDLAEVSISNIQTNGRIFFRVLAPKDMDINYQGNNQNQS